MQPVPFAEASDENRFGGKSASLGRAIVAGLPVPPGYALEPALVDAVAAGDAEAGGAVGALFDELGPRVAVRSSALGEDSDEASFAGQHATVLAVSSAAGIREAVAQVRASAHTPAALAYRAKVGIEGPPRIGVAVQRMVPSDRAGVLFTRHPVTGAVERTIEAAWGLGEVIVGGLVVPDMFRIAPDGTVLERTPGDKDLMIAPDPAGGTREVALDAVRAQTLCLDDAQLAALHALASRCEALYGPALDIEWAFVEGALYLLQCRAITASR